MTHKILIVDDEKNVLVIVKRALAGYCEVLTARNGEEGLEIIKNEKPSLVFLDIGMPGMSGISVLENIKQSGSMPIVWMLTGSEDLETAAFTLKAGASGYLTKPFELDRLRSVVFNALQDLEKGKQESRAEYKPWHIKQSKK